jgi:hypothetical protein
MGPDGRVLVGVLAASAVAVGGFFSVRAFGSTSPADSAGNVRLTTTMTRFVTVRQHGGTVVRRIPIARRIVAKPVTVEETRTVSGQGTTVVTHSIVRYRPVYRRAVVTVHGRTATEQRVATDTRQETVTNEHTSTVVETVTVVRTQTAPSQTVLVHQPPETVTVTTVGALVTIFVPTYTIP